MSRDNRIEEFIQKSLDAGIPVPSFVGLLTARGWTEKQAYSALADHYQNQTGIEVPPRPSSGASGASVLLPAHLLHALCLDAVPRMSCVLAD